MEKSIIDSLDITAIEENIKKMLEFQQAVQKNLQSGRDVGIIAGSKKPCLLKPGAEKVIMLLGLSSRYEMLDKVEDYNKGFFSYNIKCILSKGNYDICEGVGNCNSRESKYVGKDPFTITNTVLKMAKKRAYVDAALSAGNLSDIFTQDIEDMPPDMMIGNQSSHQDNQGKPLLEQRITFGKHKDRTLGDLLENERDYLEWLAYKSNNKKWGPIALEVLSKKPTSVDIETGEVKDAEVVVSPDEEKVPQNTITITAVIMGEVTLEDGKCNAQAVFFSGPESSEGRLVAPDKFKDLMSDGAALWVTGIQRDKIFEASSVALVKDDDNETVITLLSAPKKGKLKLEPNTAPQEIPWCFAEYKGEKNIVAGAILSEYAEGDTLEIVIDKLVERDGQTLIFVGEAQKAQQAG